jgi:hypothetical protein
MNPKALIWSTAIVIAMVAVFTILSELSSSVKGFFALFGHHWIGKSVLSLLTFGALYLVFAKSDRNPAHGSVWWLIGTVVLSGLAIVGFYIWHFTK